MHERLGRRTDHEEVGEGGPVGASERMLQCAFLHQRRYQLAEGELLRVTQYRVRVGPDLLSAVQTVEAVASRVAEGVILAHRTAAAGARVDEAQMIVLLEVVVGQLPVAVDLVDVLRKRGGAGNRQLLPLVREAT